MIVGAVRRPVYPGRIRAGSRRYYWGGTKGNGGDRMRYCTFAVVRQVLIGIPSEGRPMTFFLPLRMEVLCDRGCLVLDF